MSRLELLAAVQKIPLWLVNIFSGTICTLLILLSECCEVPQWHRSSDIFYGFARLYLIFKGPPQSVYTSHGSLGYCIQTLYQPQQIGFVLLSCHCKIFPCAFSLCSALLCRCDGFPGVIRYLHLDINTDPILKGNSQSLTDPSLRQHVKLELINLS